MASTPLADVTYSEASRTLLSVRNTLEPRGALWKESDLNLDWQQIDREVRIDHFPAASAVRGVYPEGQHQTYGAEWLNRMEMASHTVAAGLDVWEREMETSRRRMLATGKTIFDQPLPPSSFLSGGGFAEDDWRVTPTVALNAGGRLDWIRVENQASAQWDADESDEQSWNLHTGFTLDLGEGLDTKFVAASGYRAASLEERFQYLDLGGGHVRLGNPDLDPERSIFAEWGVSQRLKDLRLRGSVFCTQLQDLIGEERVDALTIQNANVDEALIHGAEVDCRWRMSRAWSVQGNVAYAVGRDTKAHEDLANIAPLSGLMGVAHENAAGYVGRLDVPWAAKQDRVPDGVSEAPGWATLNIGLGRRFEAADMTHEVRLGCDNLLDAAYRNYLSTFRGAEFDEPGRAFSVNYRVGF